MSREEIFRKITPVTTIVATFANADIAERAFKQISYTFVYDKAILKLTDNNIKISEIHSELYLQQLLFHLEKAGADDFSIE